MYLKKIEAQGFKSFANKTVLEFSPGIMGIVGPNGSGKSNVADAVRWVLGEQSAKQLRGSNMQDVIFAGTESRKPQGYAYVSLTIDNADHQLAIDYDEVTITRRVYRSGESEYLINGNACRLRDINELFYDTGVGKEGYSIISQGQIDKILSTKPEDRRELFDEAAGIVKFKKRKDISIKKLDEEQNNLLRVSDVLSELEKQVGPLHRQAETARTYLKLRDELKVYEVGMFFKESEDLRKKLSGVEEKLRISKEDLTSTSASVEEYRRGYEEATGKREALDRQIERDRDELSGLGIEKESIDGRVKVLDEQVGSLRAAEEELKKRLAALDEKRRGIASSKEVYTKEKGEINDKLDAMDDELASCEREMEDQEDLIREKEHQLELKQNSLLEDIRSQAGITADSQGISVKLEQAGESRTLLEESLRHLEEEIASAREKKDSLGTDAERLGALVAFDESEQGRLSSRIGELEDKLEKTDAALSAKVSEYNVARSRLEALKNMAERYEGYGEAIRQVMELKKKNKAIRGVVADIISVEKKYETAIETALGGHIQNVVTSDEATAKELVSFLKKEKLGRVTFLPMDAVRGSESADRSVFSEPGIIDTANHLVSFSPEYSGIVDRLLGRIYVSESITAALATARKYKYRLHLVTLEGEYLAPGGSITGGAFRNSSNLLSRRREVEALEKSISYLSDEGEQLRSRRETLASELSDTRSQLGEHNAALTSHREERAQVVTAFENAEASLSGLQDEMEEKRRQQQELLLLITDLNSQVESSRLAAKEAEEAETRRKSEAEALIASIESEKDKLRIINEKHTQLKLEFSRLEERDSFLLENIDRINSELESIDDEKRELLLKSDPEGLMTLAREREKEKLLKNAAELAVRIAEISERVSLSSASRDNYAAKQQELLNGRDESQSRASALEKDIIRLTNQQERLTESIQSQIDYLWNEYEMTPIEAEAQKYQGTETVSEIRRQISSHKEQIKALGPVNVNAIEEEKEVGERYEFLKGQHEDLVKARDSILEVIKELEDGMRKQFEEKFALIRDEFDKVFKDLFGGGKGTLELLSQEEGDILSAGIAIIAQPPGKKLQNMMQLSGGEKALTAIALIFAIQNLKPSPFCLLDEIEAALDETNVARFAGYLNRLKKTTQLITITHRRGTMEAAEKLYGITMQEKGISTVVSVSFTDAASRYGEADG